MSQDARKVLIKLLGRSRSLLIKLPRGAIGTKLLRATALSMQLHYSYHFDIRHVLFHFPF